MALTDPFLAAWHREGAAGRLPPGSAWQRRRAVAATASGMAGDLLPLDFTGVTPLRALMASSLRAPFDTLPWATPALAHGAAGSWEGLGAGLAHCTRTPGRRSATGREPPAGSPAEGGRASPGELYGRRAGRRRRRRDDGVRNRNNLPESLGRRNSSPKPPATTTATTTTTTSTPSAPAASPATADDYIIGLGNLRLRYSRRTGVLLLLFVTVAATLLLLPLLMPPGDGAAGPAPTQARAPVLPAVVTGEASWAP